MFYCFLADGFEEIEALAPVDILKRAGVDVTTVGVGGDSLIRGTHDIYVKPDMLLRDLVISDNISGVILPGGMPGVKNLDAEEKVKASVTYCMEHGLPVCAICAAPSILGRMGILAGKKATCFPGFEGQLLDADAVTEKVVIDHNVITARGAGCAMEFGFAIVGYVLSEDAAQNVARAMQYQL